MPDLNPENIDLIRKDIRNQEISYDNLPEELLDHICCDVEIEMQKGPGFAEAYNKVKMKIGNRRLKEIQEETLYEVDLKYRKMKNTMKISCIAGTILLNFASLFKIMHWPGAGIMMTLGALTLAFVFLPAALNVIWKESHSSKRVLFFVLVFLAGMLFIMGILFRIQHWSGTAPILALSYVLTIITLTLSIRPAMNNAQKTNQGKIIYLLAISGFILYITAVLFKIQHWPGSGTLTISSLIIIFFVVFPWYTVITWKEEKSVRSRFIFIVIGSLLIVFPSALIKLNIQKTEKEKNTIYYQNENSSPDSKSESVIKLFGSSR